MPRLLVVHDDPTVVATVEVGFADSPAWSVGATEHGDIAVAEAAHYDAIVVDLRRAPVDGWFALAQLVAAGRRDVVAIGSRRTARRAMRLGAGALVRDPEAVAALVQRTSGSHDYTA